MARFFSLSTAGARFSNAELGRERAFVYDDGVVDPEKQRGTVRFEQHSMGLRRARLRLLAVVVLSAGVAACQPDARPRDRDPAVRRTNAAASSDPAAATSGSGTPAPRDDGSANQRRAARLARESAPAPTTPRADEGWLQSLSNSALLAAMPDSVTAAIVRRLDRMPLPRTAGALSAPVQPAAGADAIEEMLSASHPLLICCGAAPPRSPGTAGSTERAPVGSGLERAPWRLIVVSAPLEGLLSGAHAPPDPALQPNRADGYVYYELQATADAPAKRYAALANDRTLALAPTLADLSVMLTRIRRGDSAMPARWAAAAAGLDIAAPLVAVSVDGDHAAGSFAENLAIACGEREPTVEFYGVALDPDAVLRGVVDVAGRFGAPVVARERLRESSFLLSLRFEGDAQRELFLSEGLPAVTGVRAP